MKYLLPLILIVISGGLFLLWIDPTYKDIQVVIEENNGYVEALEQVREVREKRQEIQDIVNTIDPNRRERLEKILPERINNINLILDVNNIADSNGMNISDIRINDEIETNNDGRATIATSDEVYNTVAFAFSVVTTYDNFKKFLSDLALSLRVVDVTTVTITPINANNIESEGAPIVDLYRFDVGIDTYWLESEEITFN